MLLNATFLCRQSVWTRVYPIALRVGVRWRTIHKLMWSGFICKLQACYQDLEEAACSISLMPFQAARLQACRSSALQPEMGT